MPGNRPWPARKAPAASRRRASPGAASSAMPASISRRPATRPAHTGPGPPPTNTHTHNDCPEQNAIIVTGSDGPQLVTYDDNDQYSVGPSGEVAPTSMAAFEDALAADADDDNEDTVVVSS